MKKQRIWVVVLLVIAATLFKGCRVSKPHAENALFPNPNIRIDHIYMKNGDQEMQQAIDTCYGLEMQYVLSNNTPNSLDSIFVEIVLNGNHSLLRNREYLESHNALERKRFLPCDSLSLGANRLTIWLFNKGILCDTLAKIFGINHIPNAEDDEAKALKELQLKIVEKLRYIIISKGNSITLNPRFQAITSRKFDGKLVSLGFRIIENNAEITHCQRMLPKDIEPDAGAIICDDCCTIKKLPRATGVIRLEISATYKSTQILQDTILLDQNLQLVFNQ
jgi:hypothetical protein